MAKKPIYLIDLAHDSRLGLGSDTMPLQLGLVGAYCLGELADQVEIRIFKFTADFEAAVREAPPFLVGVSNYIWNIDLGYKTIEILKRHHHDTIVVGGGGVESPPATSSQPYTSISMKCTPAFWARLLQCRTYRPTSGPQVNALPSAVSVGP